MYANENERVVHRASERTLVWISKFVRSFEFRNSLVFRRNAAHRAVRGPSYGGSGYDRERSGLRREIQQNRKTRAEHARDKCQLNGHRRIGRPSSRTVYWTPA